MAGSACVVLVPFTEQLLAAVQPWFHHPEVVLRSGRMLG
jgi:hypothetical protein